VNAVIWVWLQFAAAAAIIGVAGAALCRSADIIAKKTGLSRGWIGFILLATVTSLPELVTGISAVTWARAPNLAVGDVLGSCVLNLAILTVVDLVHRRESFYRRAGQGHILSAAFGIVLIGVAGLGVIVGKRGDGFAIGHIGAYTPLIVLLYAVAARTIFTYERRERTSFAETVAERYPHVTLRTAIVRYAFRAGVVIAAGAWLPFVAVELARVMGWQTTFVGQVFVAAATSLPELSVTISALRLGAVDLAIANLLGSNLFDILILAIDDLFFLDGPLLSHVSSTHAVSALSAAMMSGVVIVGLLYRPNVRIAGLVGWVSIALALMFLFSAYATFLYGH
jgi:cation:H+ antiporter